MREEKGSLLLNKELGMRRHKIFHNSRSLSTTLFCKTLLIAIVFLSGCVALSGMPDLRTPDGQIYAKRCKQCHGLPEPRFRTMREWEPIVLNMMDKIREKELQPLPMNEHEAILRYLARHAKPE